MASSSTFLPSGGHLASEGLKVFIDPTGYKAFVADGQATLQKALAAQQKAFTTH